MDKNERLAYLDTRHLNNTAKRIIKSTLNEIERQKSNGLITPFQEHKEQSVKNALFLKFIGADYEGLFQNNYENRKIPKRV